MSETLNYRQVIARAIIDAMNDDPRVIMIGEDIGAAGGAFKTTAGVFEAIGPERVRDTPISEQAIVGAALGAAMTGLRPIAEIMFADFAGVCFDQIVNQVAKYRYMTGGQVTVPLTIRMANGAGAGFTPYAAEPAQAGLVAYRLVTGSLKEYLSPCVRQLVEVNDVDVGSIRGTGRDGRVRKSDVNAHLNSRALFAPLPANAGTALDRSVELASPAFMTVEVDLTGHERSTEESLAALAAAVGRVLVLERGPEDLPDRWLRSLSIVSPGSAATITIGGHRMLSVAGLVRAIQQVDAVDGAQGHVDLEPTRLVLTSTSHPSLTAEGSPLRTGVAAALVLGIATRRPVVFGAASGEVLAFRSVASLTLTYDPAHLRRDAASWFITSLAAVLGEPTPDQQAP